MPYNNSNDRNQSKTKQKKHKSKNLPLLGKYEHDIFNCPFMQTPERDKVQYLYADPCFIPQATTRQRAGNNNAMQDQDKFYDCEGDSLSDFHRDQNQYNIADVIDNIKDPQEFRCLLKEVADTSQILYRCFRKAFHKAKNANPEGVSKKYEKCEKCLRRRRENLPKKSKLRETGEKSGEEMNACDYRPQVTGIPRYQNSKEPLECDKADCDCSKDHKVGENFLDNEKHENKDCDCLANSQGLIKGGKGQNNDNAMAFAENWNDFQIYKHCPDSYIDYNKMSYCEKCARLRGEAWEAEQVVNKIEEDILGSLKDSTTGSAEIIRFPEKSVEIAKQFDISEMNLNLLTDISRVEMISTEMARRANEVAIEPRKFPALNKKQCRDLQKIAIYNINPKPQYHPKKDVTKNSNSATNSSPQTSSNAPYPLNPTLEAQRTCACHRRQRSQRAPTKKRSTTKYHHEKRSTRSHNVHMQPVIFTLPMNLQIQTRSGETRFFQTEVQMEATAEPGKRKPKSKPKSYGVEPIRTATIAAITSASQTQTEHTSGFQKQAELVETTAFGDVFYSCSSSTSSVVETIPPQPDKPCEALVEIFELIKKRVTNNKNVPSHIIKDLTAFDINECLTKKTTSPLPLIPEKIHSSEIKRRSASTETPQPVETKKPTTVSNSETQTEPLVSEDSSTKPVAPVSPLSQYIEECLNKPKTLTVEPLLYHQGTGCFDLPLTDRPRIIPPEDPLQEVINDLEQKSKTTSKSLINEPLSDNTMPKIEDIEVAESTKPVDSTLVPPTTEQIREAKRESANVETLKPYILPATSIASILRATPPTPPASPPPPRPPLPAPPLAAKMSAVAQTEILSSSAYSHLKRNDMRKDIMENLEELVKPTTSNTKNKYDPDEKVEILRNLHKLFTPKRAAGQLPEAESHDSVLEDIQLLLNPRKTQKSVSSSTISTSRHKSKSHLRKTRSTEVILKDIRHVLNPKGGEKPSKRFSRDNREHVLEHLHSLLTPRSQKNLKPEPETETRESVLQDLRILLDIPKADDRISLPKPLKPPTKPKPKFEYLQSSSDDFMAVEKNRHNKSKIIDYTKSPGSKTGLHEETNRPHTSRQAPPTPKKPKSKTSRPVEENETHKVDNSELIPSSQVRNQTERVVTTQMEDGISLVSTSSDSFFVNLDDNQSDARPSRLSSFLRRSQYYADSDEEKQDFKKHQLDKKHENLPQSDSRNQAQLQNVMPKLNIHMGKLVKKPLDKQKICKSQDLEMCKTENEVPVHSEASFNIRSSASQTVEPLQTTLPETSTNSNRTQNRNQLSLCPLRGFENLNSGHQCVRIDSKEDFRPFNRLKSERTSVIAEDKKRSSKSFENKEETVKQPGESVIAGDKRKSVTILKHSEKTVKRPGSQQKDNQTEEEKKKNPTVKSLRNL